MSSIGNEPRHSLFISDLHLCSSRPAITSQFIAFLRTTAAKAEALYILGDLFEYWAGDDDLDDPHHQDVIVALKALASTGTQAFFHHRCRERNIRGNHHVACRDGGGDVIIRHIESARYLHHVYPR